VYASMTGSGSSLYGIFSDGEVARAASDAFRSTYEEVWLFKL
ncbi:MAG: hypothetical protein K2K95_11675, partial [Muribaculaceae bacterium]|nr:hypothetical protein [Muribaculaceae bacterium]